MLSTLSLAAIALMLAPIVAGLATRRVLVSGLLILSNIAVFLLSDFGPKIGSTFDGSSISLVQAELGLFTDNLVHGQAVGFLQIFTSLFVHWDFLHLLGNMVALLLFGVPFEQRVGPRKFLAIYFLGGLAATLAQVGAEWGHATFLVGASGCIFAILGAFAIRFPNQVVPVPLFFLVIPMRVVYGAVAYLALQILYLASYQDVPGLGGTAYYAHLGGAAAGVLLGLTLVRPGAAKSPIAVDLKALEPFARDPKTKVVWDHMIANHDEPAVFQAWLDRFFRSATCPTCGHRVAPRSSGTVVCTQNHRFDVRQGAPAPVAAASAPVRQG